jgi:hypothetical protein
MHIKFVGNLEEMIQVWGRDRRWGDNIKKDLKGIAYEDADWIHLRQERT